MVLVSFATVKTAKLVEPGLVYEPGVVQSADQKAKPVEVYLTIAIIIAVLILWWVFR
jgi:hypothetical protein